MSESWRMLETGLRPAAQNIALSRALLEARRAHEVPSTLRFLRHAPAVLLGAQQSAEQELDLAYCTAHAVPIQRRISAGRAACVNPAQLGWELALHAGDCAGNASALIKRICHAAATALGALGLDARWRAPGDIEIEGRTVGAVSATADGNAVLFQGTISITGDHEHAARVLRTPGSGALCGRSSELLKERMGGIADDAPRAADPARLKRLLLAAFESDFDAEFQESDLTLTEQARFRTALMEIETPDWLELVRRPLAEAPLCEATRDSAAGALQVALIYDRALHRIRQVWFICDGLAAPRRTMLDLEALLAGTSIERVEPNVHGFFTGRDAPLPLQPHDLIGVLRQALKFPLVAQHP